MFKSKKERTVILINEQIELFHNLLEALKACSNNIDRLERDYDLLLPPKKNTSSRDFTLLYLPRGEIEKMEYDLEKRKKALDMYKNAIGMGVGDE